jgi:hypothetical protein
MKTTILSIILIAILPGFIEAQKISEWRPENRTGVSAETGLMKSWPAAGPTLLWSNLDLAKGYSSPSFGTNTIYNRKHRHQRYTVCIEHEWKDSVANCNGSCLEWIYY